MNPSSLSFFDLSIGIDYHATRFQFDFPLFGSVQPCFFSTRFRKKSVKLVIEPRTTRRCFQASTNPLPRSIAFHRSPGRTMRRFIVDHDPDAALFFESSGSRRRCHCSPAVSVTDRKRSLPQKPNLLSRYTDGKREYLSLLRSDRLFFLSVYTSDFVTRFRSRFDRDPFVFSKGFSFCFLDNLRSFSNYNRSRANGSGKYRDNPWRGTLLRHRGKVLIGLRKLVREGIDGYHLGSGKARCKLTSPSPVFGLGPTFDQNERPFAFGHCAAEGGGGNG